MACPRFLGTESRLVLATIAFGFKWGFIWAAPGLIEGTLRTFLWNHLSKAWLHEDLSDACWEYIKKCRDWCSFAKGIRRYCTVHALGASWFECC